MTERQKEAIGVLNRLMTVGGKAAMTNDEYFTILEFIVESTRENLGITWKPFDTGPYTAPDIPLYPTTITPKDPPYPYETFC